MFSMQELFKGGHITETALLAISCDLAETEELQLILSHIGSCEECRERFILDMETNLLPEEEIPQMEQSVLYLIEEEKEKQAEKKNRFRFVQITKLAIAVCLTMVMFTGLALMSGGEGQLLHMASQRPKQDISLTDNQQRYEEEEKNRNSRPGEQILSFTQNLYNNFFDFAKGLSNTRKQPSE